ncbi:MAG: beta-lactamase family protein [Tannerellaceae bacterium]|nr:beta-lactamase family protein [Tannerellaceae bacterium]
MKKVTAILSGIIVILLVILFLPSNYYLRKAFIHQLPKIDQYPIFENRIVKAGAPQPWELHDEYNRHSLPDQFRESFATYGTIGFLIIKDGKLLFEEYWENYSPHSRSNSFSMAKSIVSLAVGCALDEGFIQDINQPVRDFFPNFSQYGNDPVTIRHLLTMSAGVDFQEAYTSPFSPTTKIYYGKDLAQITFAMKAIEKPGVYFEYQSGVTQLLGFLVEKATGETLSEYVSRKLWTPMGAEEDALWSLDHPGGMEKAYCCFNTNARDFARFGQLLLNNGKWNDKQLISPDYLTAAITPDTTLLNRDYQEINQAYGYQFWHLIYKGLSIPYLRGILGQYIFAIPEENAVVVRLGHKRSEIRTEQHYPEDIDIWLQAALTILHQTTSRASHP